MKAVSFQALGQSRAEKLRRHGSGEPIIAMTEMTLLVDTLVRLWMERKGTSGNGCYTRGSLYLMTCLLPY